MANSKNFTLKCPEIIDITEEIPEQNQLMLDLNEPSHLSDSETNSDSEELCFDLTKFLSSITENDLEIEEKCFIPIADKEIKNSLRRHCTNKAIKIMKARYLNYYKIKLENGFYSGFMGTIICENCRMILDAYPCREKRLYWVQKGNCPYCADALKVPSHEDYAYIEKMERCTKNKKMYQFNVKFEQ